MCLNFHVFLLAVAERYKELMQDEKEVMNELTDKLIVRVNFTDDFFFWDMRIYLKKTNTQCLVNTYITELNTTMA